MKTQHHRPQPLIARGPRSIPDKAVGVVQSKISLYFARWALFAVTFALAFALLFVVISPFSLSARAQADPAQASASNYPNWWQSVQTNYSTTLNALWIDGSNRFYAVGDKGVILRTTRSPADPDFGSSWQAMTSNTTERLQAIWGADSTHIFAGGVNGTILFYNGSAWSKMNVQPIYHIYDLWGTGSSDVYAVGLMRDMSAPATPLIMYGVVLHYDGQSWSLAHSYQVANGTSNFQDIWGSSATDIYVTGMAYDAQTSHHIWHYDGSEWTSTTLTGLSVYQVFQDIWGSGANDIFAVIGCAASLNTLPCGENGKPAIYHFDGQNWTLMVGVTEHFLSYSLGVAGALPFYEVPYGLWGDSPDNVFLVGSRGLILHYDGSAWRQLPNGYGDTTLFAISGFGQDLAAVGQDGDILSYAETHLSCADVTQISRAECEILVDVYLSTNARINSNRTARWLQNIYPCGANPDAFGDPFRWYTVFCSGGRVVGLFISYQPDKIKRPSGLLPQSVSQLTELRQLWAENVVAGPFPTWLGQLTRLTELHLRSNVFDGSLPPSLGNLAELTNLDLFSEYSNLQGPLPAELGDLSKLKMLNVAGNRKLGGALPTTLSQLTQVEEFRFFSTSLCIPADAALQNWLVETHGTIYGTNVACASTHAVSGVVRDADGNPLAGAEVAAQRTGQPSWYGFGVSAADGSYVVPGLRDGVYTLHPNRESTTFTPITRTATIAAADVSGQDFVGVAPQVHFKTESLAGQNLQPGSKVIIQTSDFPADGQGRILINGQFVGALPMNAEGAAAFLLDTSAADPGAYFVTVTVNPSAAMQLRLSGSGELVEESDDALPTVEAPGGSALQLTHLPLVDR